MAIVVRGFVEADRAGVEALRDGDPDPIAGQRQSLHGPDRDGPRWRRTLVAVHGDRVLGAASATRSLVHPARLPAAVEVAPGVRRRGIGTRLVAALSELAERPWRGKVHTDDPAAHGFALALGATTFQRCLCPVLDPADPELRAWSERYDVGSDDLTGLSPTELLAAWTDFYEWIHAPWAPTGPRAVLVEAFGPLVAGIDRALSAGVWRGERLAAVAFAMPGAGGRVDLCAETLRPDEPAGTALVVVALAGCLRRLAAAGPRVAAEAHLDGHVTDPHLGPLVGGLPARSARELLLVELR